MAKRILPLAGAAWLFGIVTLACGGSAEPADATPYDAATSVDAGRGDSDSVAIPTRTVGGKVTGLTGTGLVLQNNGEDDLTIDGNGTFVFATMLASRMPFAVTVKTQPMSPSQTCVVTGGTGIVSSADVTSVSVDCTTNEFTVGGTVTGLADGNGVVLQNNGGDDLTVASNGSFTFTTAVESGKTFAVSVLTQPNRPNQTCVVTGESGTVVAGPAVNVSVICTKEMYSAGGYIHGLNSAGLVLQNNGTELSVFGAGNFDFAMPPQEDGSSYAITVTAQPTSELCSVLNGTGTLAGANTYDALVHCIPASPTHAIHTDVTGLAGSPIVLTNNGGDELSVAPTTNAVFSTPLPPGATYDIAIKTQPADRECVITNGSGTMGDGLIVVHVACSYPGCRTVKGLQWCRDTVAARSCSTLCSSIGLTPPTLKDVTWFSAQNDAVECSALASAFAVAATSVGSYHYGCAQVHQGTMYCSSYPACPLNLRTTSDSSPDAYSICPCGGLTACGTGNEGGKATVTCPGGTVISSIRYASYGLPNGACGNFTNGSCHVSAKASAEASCLGLPSCSVDASSPVLGDPCPGSNKRLYIEAECQ